MKKDKKINQSSKTERDITSVMKFAFEENAVLNNLICSHVRLRNGESHIVTGVDLLTDDKDGKCGLIVTFDANIKTSRRYDRELRDYYKETDYDIVRLLHITSTGYAEGANYNAIRQKDVEFSMIQYDEPLSKFVNMKTGGPEERKDLQ